MSNLRNRRNLRIVNLSVPPAVAGGSINLSVPPAVAGGSINSPWESLPILAGDQERFHHLGLPEITVESIKLRQPEVIAIKVCVRSRVWIPAQVAEVLHQHKR